MQFLSALLRSNLGIEQSSSHPAHPISRCSCIRVVPSFSGAMVPVTVLICFMGRLLGDNRAPKLVACNIEMDSRICYPLACLERPSDCHGPSTRNCRRECARGCCVPVL